MTAAGRQAQAAGTGSASAGPPVVHTAEEAARLLKVKKSWLQRQAAERRIPFTMLGGSYRFSDRHLAEIVRMNEIAPVPAACEAPPPSRAGRNAGTTGAAAALAGPLQPRPRSGPRRVA